MSLPLSRREAGRRSYYKRKVAGLCVWCGGKKNDKRVTCLKCRMRT